MVAVALCMFPKALEADDARAILAGGQQKVNEAGAQIVGGHTVRGDELFYGLSVTGVVHPDKIVRNVGQRGAPASQCRNHTCESMSTGRRSSRRSPLQRET